MRQLFLLLLIACVVGCSSAGQHRRPLAIPQSQTAQQQNKTNSQAQTSPQTNAQSLEDLLLVSQEQTTEQDSAVTPALQETPIPTPEDVQKSLDNAFIHSLPQLLSDEPEADVTLEAIIGSIYTSFPSVQAAMQQRNIAYGGALEASGEFDFKVKGASENGPVGFHRTYRQSIGFNQALLSGGEVFGGYRIGRGTFQPWYQERQTNDAGELKAGVSIPLAQNRSIDARRAALWKANIGRLKAEPEIQMELIIAILAGSEQYWEWVAAGQRYKIAQSILDVTNRRTAGIELEVKVGKTDPPVLQENQRQILSRESKLISAEQKLIQSANKLSLFFRTSDGTPIIALNEQIPEFPEPEQIDAEQMAADLQLAMQMRPDIQVLEFERKQLNIELTQAINLRKPQLDAQIIGSQDMGEPTSSKRDKSRFELEAGLFLDVPLQRRKANGKITALQGKLSQLQAKRELLENKITIDLQNTYAALNAAYESYQRADQSAQLAQQLVEVEKARLDVGQSDLFTLFLKEQVAVTAMEERISALLEYYLAQANYRAVMAQDQSL